MNTRLQNALWGAVVSLGLFASILYDMEFSPDNTKRWLLICLGLAGYSVYQLVCGLRERADAQKRQRSAAHNR